QRQIDEGYEKIAGFGNITDIYAHYTYSEMTVDELNRVDRVEVIDLLNRIVMSHITIGSYSASGNTLTVAVSADTLQEINSIRNSLLEEQSVEYCAINNAVTVKTEGTDAERVNAQITIRLVNVARDDAEFLGGGEKK
ncbi:MAG: hypothetical protein IJU75_03370, partial [Clostridia bacterium]|nr:hypothetical protein [Clostridia bacterium]